MGFYCILLFAANNVLPPKFQGANRKFLLEKKNMNADPSFAQHSDIIVCSQIKIRNRQPLLEGNASPVLNKNFLTGHAHCSWFQP